ncbi:uncharacterized protein L3040_008023 [Drepanopeziza brunnea f. sp. 'multigermtubi']|uniref:uncharacterized protein n=1 Tax=Drepanopeziza brunnea f. sp. 'multigermtubi' TaxID=698441 RepID=UPI0023A16F6C|nr:hypothetical protein L3040_008023 [Drepanopeziza brunnea f. sp. 'multigermtubi']
MPHSKSPCAEAPHNDGLWQSKKTISFEDYLVLESLVFEWADSYDAKDWARLKSILAPDLLIDYTSIGKACLWPKMSAAAFVKMVSSPNFLGNPCLETQHLLGARRYERVSDSRIIGYHQIRAAHQVYTTPALEEVRHKGHVHASNVHYYAKVNGEWKFAGLKPTVRWSEHEFERVFRDIYEDMEMPAVDEGEVGEFRDEVLGSVAAGGQQILVEVH